MSDQNKFKFLHLFDRKVKKTNRNFFFLREKYLLNLKNFLSELIFKKTNY